MSAASSGSHGHTIAEELSTVLATVVFLQGESAAVCAKLAGLAICHGYPKGNILYYSGESGDAIYVVLEGRVKVSLMNAEGREVVLAALEPGGVFGLVEALDGGPRAGTAMTLTACRLAKISPDRFLAWLREHPLVHQRLLICFAQMLREAYGKVGEQALLPVKRRLYATLLEIARSEGEHRGQDVVFERPTHQELAERTGSSRVVISRTLKELLEEEELAADGRVIRLPMSALLTKEEF